ncbi:ABC transporter permease [Serpentinicella alkaliphila]|uniref:ABC-2 type transport system permease protein n=1 Tax=Serpentinicella alkaliphila TaxID=1734049 RepID=A0A4R2TFA7_9FIRM|nr:ABC transporter permease [Serpentinicella alkaliphila]QUH25952.1 ABC transporter permease [Serpentinicella alkaliphila]TCQ02058.1 ABC-2 type transport system permease protein [Serpentinicella alkaliphila]
MSFHIFKYSFKSLIKDKMSLFWMLCFPLILATFFNLAFANVMSNEVFNPVKIAIVTDHTMPLGLEKAMNESNLFNISHTTEAEAKDLLSNRAITGYIKNTDGLELVIFRSGLNQSISKVFLDNFVQISATIYNIIDGNPQLIQMGFLEDISFNESFIEEVPLSSAMNIIVVYYFALLAMTCLFSAVAGSYAISIIQANQSPLAARLNVAPTHKLKAFLSVISATICFQFMSVIIAITYISKFLNVDFGDRIIHIGVLCLVGCFTGTMFGSLFGLLTKFKSEIKDMLVSNIVMVMCFLSGLMVIQVKYFIQEKAPIIAYINPANLITDGLYALYYYDTFDRYFLNLGLLASLGVIFCTSTILILRRQKYASI